MLPHQLISRALLKAKGRPPKEFYGLEEPDFRELALLARNCEKQLGLSTVSLSPLGTGGRSGVRLSLSGQRFSYSAVLSPSGVHMESVPLGSQPRQVFRQKNFNHLVAGQLFRAIETEEKQKPWLT